MNHTRNNLKLIKKVLGEKLDARFLLRIKKQDMDVLKAYAKKNCRKVNSVNDLINTILIAWIADLKKNV